MGRGRLSRELVLATALELVDREGLSALSMRRVAAELGVEPMALYRYADGKDALLDGLVEALYLKLDEALAEDPRKVAHIRGSGARRSPAWRRELHRIAQTMYRIALEHPGVVPLLATRLLAVPLARRPMAVLREHERVLDLLAEADLDPRTCVRVFRAYTAWVLGYIFAELRAMVDAPDEPQLAFRLGLHHMPPRELPRLRAIAPALAEHGGPRGLATGLDTLLDRFLHGTSAPQPPGGPRGNGKT